MLVRELRGALPARNPTSATRQNKNLMIGICLRLLSYYLEFFEAQLEVYLRVIIR